MPAGLPSGTSMAQSRFERGRSHGHKANCRSSIDKAEEPVENSKNIMTPFDGGLSFPKPEEQDHSSKFLYVTNGRLHCYYIFAEFDGLRQPSRFRTSENSFNANRSVVFHPRPCPRTENRKHSQEEWNL